MKRMIWIILAGLIIPTAAWALDFGWESDPADRSVYYLGHIFGQMGVVLIGQGNEIVGEILRIFNIAVLTVGTIVVVYSGLVSTMSTAQEGEVMGKKWSSIWIPIRSASGLALMLPTASGFSLIQILMMWIIIQGVHGANQIWAIILDKAQQGQGLTSTLKVNEGAMASSAVGIMYGAACANFLNDDASFQADTDGARVEIYQPIHKTDELWIGVEGDSTYDKSCGVIKAANFDPKAMYRDQWNRQQLAGGELAYLSVFGYADEVFEPRADWTGQGVIRDGALSMRGAITNVDLVPAGDAFSAEALRAVLESTGLPASFIDAIINNMGAQPGGVLQRAKQDGWIHAGSYYFKLIEASGADIRINPPTYQAPSDADYARGSFQNDIKGKVNAYVQVSDGAASSGGTVDTSQINLKEPSGLNSDVRRAMGSSVSGFSSLMRAFIDRLSNRDQDPIKSFQLMGSEILIAVEAIFFALVILLPIIMGIACIMSGVSPGCYIPGIIIVILFPVLLVVLALLWSAGVALGIYLPLVPFFVFTFAAMGWFMLVVETIVAAPIVALGITAPGQDAMGKASPAVLLITNVFLRPSLLVIGFIAAARLVKAVMNMVNYGFEGFVLMNVGVLLLFGNIALIVIYAGVAIAAIHQVFSLTYVLADKVIRWIGGQAEQSMVEQAMEETKKASETAAESTSAVMKGAGEAVVKMAKSAVSKGMSEPEQGGESGGGGGGGGGLSLGGSSGGSKGGGMGSKNVITDGLGGGDDDSGGGGLDDLTGGGDDETPIKGGGGGSKPPGGSGGGGGGGSMPPSA